MTITPTLHTDRLLLTPLQLEDAPAVQQRFPLWDIVRYLNNRVPWPYPRTVRCATFRTSHCPP